MSEFEEIHEGVKELQTLKLLIRHVYMPMEEERENIKSLLSNFSKSTSDTIDQVSGSKEIKLPEYLEPDDEVAINSRSTIEEYQGYLVSLYILNHFLTIFQKKITKLIISF